MNDDTATVNVLGEIYQERFRQDEKWGQQNHPDGTGPDVPNPIISSDMKYRAWLAREICNDKHSSGIGTWQQILEEEVSEAFAEDNPTQLREELIQTAAVAVAWIEAIDRRGSRKDD